jgi:hypothetical protein
MYLEKVIGAAWLIRYLEKVIWSGLIDKVPGEGNYVRAPISV